MPASTNTGGRISMLPSATPAEAAAYRAMLADVAHKAAEASKEGGFLGFGGVRVSDAEHAFIAEVKQAAGIA